MPAPRRSRVLVSLAAAAIVLVGLVGGLVLTRSGDEPEAPIVEVPSTTTTVPGPSAPTTSAVGPDDPMPDLRGVPWDRPHAGTELAVVGVAADDVLNVRTGPGVDFEVAYTLGPLEDAVIATGQNRQLPSGDVWALVRQGGREGWVNAAYLLLPSSTDDVTASNFPSPADLPQASTMEDLARLVADAVARVLAGIPEYQIASEWRAAGIKTSMGREWTVEAITGVLSQARIAGLREHHGEIVAEATWPAIIDRATWEHLQSLFRSRRRGPRRSPTPSLLSGLLRCWRCGATLNASRWEGKPRYFCRPAMSRGCAGVAVVRDHADAAVTQIVLTRVASVEYAHALAGRAGEGDADLGVVADLVGEDRPVPGPARRARRTMARGRHVEHRARTPPPRGSGPT